MTVTHMETIWGEDENSEGVWEQGQGDEMGSGLHMGDVTLGALAT